MQGMQHGNRVVSTRQHKQGNSTAGDNRATGPAARQPWSGAQGTCNKATNLQGTQAANTGRHDQRMRSTAAKRKATPTAQPHYTANTSTCEEPHAKQAGQAAGQRQSADKDVRTSNAEQSGT
ncbi:hypothetical protein CBR_g37425 [Chara braunii]|uniref:Uncharacterized protein n=1 Tax=Chara braunii TaxID=69332 RepID=A0A388LMW9_CHABU|nr:hypothetical protein CBR_g37425 [Chara braunii]|eukprot:GBG83621.1 hypothetical protein CBR_g37425 [Chara braunii]